MVRYNHLKELSDSNDKITEENKTIIKIDKNGKEKKVNNVSPHNIILYFIDKNNNGIAESSDTHSKCWKEK